MKLPFLQTSLLIAVTIGTTYGANPMFAADAPANPELQQADQRVSAAEAQLDLAKRQLTAARSLLKAAEADLRAARADRQALALRQTAHGLAEEAGMRPDNNRSLASSIQSGPLTAQPAAAPATLTPTTVSSLDNTPSSAPTPAAAPVSSTDYGNAAEEPPTAPQLMLR